MADLLKIMGSLALLIGGSAAISVATFAVFRLTGAPFTDAMFAAGIALGLSCGLGARSVATVIGEVSWNGGYP